MPYPFIGEIRILPYLFAPEGWAYCNGSILPIGQCPALFAVIGTTYGGDGRTTFGLPNLKGRAPLGLSPQYYLGAMGGSSGVTLTTGQMPRHTHQMAADFEIADKLECANDEMLAITSGRGNKIYNENTDILVPLNSAALTSTGSSSPHENMQPYQALNFCIALDGFFPPRP